MFGDQTEYVHPPKPIFKLNPLANQTYRNTCQHFDSIPTDVYPMSIPTESTRLDKSNSKISAPHNPRIQEIFVPGIQEYWSIEIH